MALRMKIGERGRFPQHEISMADALVEADMNAKPDIHDSNIQTYMREVGHKARAAARLLGCLDTGVKNAALLAIAENIESSIVGLMADNGKDLEAGRRRGLDAALLDRLMLTEARIASMAHGLRQIAALPDPVGAVTDLDYRPSGIQVGRMRVPLGVIGIIYESRPNVTADAAALCFKSGNAAILRGARRPSIPTRPSRAVSRTV